MAAALPEVNLDQVANRAAKFALEQIAIFITAANDQTPLLTLIQNTRDQFLRRYPEGIENRPVLELVQLISGNGFSGMIHMGRPMENNGKLLDKQSSTVACVRVDVADHMVYKLRTFIPHDANILHPLKANLVQLLIRAFGQTLPRTIQGANIRNVALMMRADIAQLLADFWQENNLAYNTLPVIHPTVAWELINGTGRIRNICTTIRGDMGKFETGQKFFLQLRLTRANVRAKFTIWVGSTVIIQSAGPAVLGYPSEQQENENRLEQAAPLPNDGLEQVVDDEEDVHVEQVVENEYDVDDENQEEEQNQEDNIEEDENYQLDGEDINEENDENQPEVGEQVAVENEKLGNVQENEENVQSASNAEMRSPIVAAGAVADNIQNEVSEANEENSFQQQEKNEQLEQYHEDNHQEQQFFVQDEVNVEHVADLLGAAAIINHDVNLMEAEENPGNVEVVDETENYETCETNADSPKEEPVAGPSKPWLRQPKIQVKTTAKYDQATERTRSTQEARKKAEEEAKKPKSFKKPPGPKDKDPSGPKDNHPKK